MNNEQQVAYTWTYESAQKECRNLAKLDLADEICRNRRLVDWLLIPLLWIRMIPIFVIALSG